MRNQGGAKKRRKWTNVKKQEESNYREEPKDENGRRGEGEGGDL